MDCFEAKRRKAQQLMAEKGVAALQVTNREKYRIAYFNQPKFLRGNRCLFVVDKFDRYVRSAFVALDG
jgi:hypothetical protein